MAINKVTKNGQILIDLSQDTVTSAGDIVAGKVGHLRDGTQVPGTAQIKTLQPSKSYTATTNDTFTIGPDSNYDGMEQVSLTVNVPVTEYDDAEDDTF